MPNAPHGGQCETYGHAHDSHGNGEQDRALDDRERQRREIPQSANESPSSPASSSGKEETEDNVRTRHPSMITPPRSAVLRLFSCGWTGAESVVASYLESYAWMTRPVLSKDSYCICARLIKSMALRVVKRRCGF